MSKKKSVKAVSDPSVLERLEGQTTLSILNTGFICGHALAIGQVMEYLTKIPGLLAGNKDLETYIMCLRKVIEVLKYENEQATKDMMLKPDIMLEAIERLDRALRKRKDGKFITYN